MIRWALGTTIGMAIVGALACAVGVRIGVALFMPLLLVLTALAFTAPRITEFPTSPIALPDRTERFRAAAQRRSPLPMTKISTELRAMAERTQRIIDEMVRHPLPTDAGELWRRRDASEAAARARDAMIIAAGALESDYRVRTMPTRHVPTLLAGGAA